MSIANANRNEEEQTFKVGFMDMIAAINPPVTFYLANFNLIGNYIADLPDMQVEIPPEFLDGGDKSDQDFGGVAVFDEDGQPIEGVV